MNGVHDMGGMHGFGPVKPEADEPVFHHAWEGRLYGIHSQVRGIYEPGGTRFALERLDPAFYLASSYFERWLRRMELALVAKGVVTQEEIESKTAFYRDHPEASVPRRESTAQASGRRPAARESSENDGTAEPKFRVGQEVIGANTHSIGHTRLPRYVRGRRGVVIRFYGLRSQPDTDGDGIRLFATPQPLYNVRFEGEELWGKSAEPRENIYLDMWESYLESAAD